MAHLHFSPPYTEALKCSWGFAEVLLTTTVTKESISFGFLAPQGKLGRPLSQDSLLSIAW